MIIYQNIEKLPQNTLSIKTIAKYIGSISQDKLATMYIQDADNYEDTVTKTPLYTEDGNWEEDNHLSCSIQASLTCFRSNIDDEPNTNWFMQFLPTTFTAPILDAVRCAGYIEQTSKGVYLKVGNDTQSDKKGIEFGNGFTSGMFYSIKGGYIDENGDITYVDLTNNAAENNLQEGYPTNPSIYSINNLSTDFPTNVYPYDTLVAHSGTISIKTNFKLFTSKLEMDTYLKTGIAIDPINKDEDEPIIILDVTPQHKYIYCSTCETDTQSKSADYEIINQRNLDMWNSKFVEGNPPWVAAFVAASSQDTYFNIVLKFKDEVLDAEYFEWKNVENGTTTEGTHWDYINRGRFTYTELFGNDPYYFGKLNTNIPIFSSEDMADRYLNGEITDKDSLNGGGNYSGAASSIGEELDETEYNDASFNSSMSKALIFNEATLNEVAGILYDVDEQSAIIDGLSLHGENPASFIADLFYVPFDINYFCANSGSLSKFHFGTYEVNIQNSYTVVKKSNVRHTMFTAFIDGAFGDFRDYYSNYYLYLPYVSIFPIDTETWLYHTMQVDVTVDVYTGAVKYYLLSDGRLIDTKEGNIRVTLPIASTNKYEGAINKIEGGIGLVTSAASAGVGLGASIATGNIGGAINSITGGVSSMVTNAIKLDKAPPKSFSGNYSPSVAINDPLNAFLIIEQHEIEYPADLPNKFGIPDNDVATIGSRSGYVVCDEVRFNFNCLKEEQEAIKALLLHGIVI